METLKFNEFKFVDPIFDLHGDCEFQSVLQTLNNTACVKYGYLVLLMIGVVLIIKSDATSLRKFINTVNIFSKLETLQIFYVVCYKGRSTLSRTMVKLANLCNYAKT